MSTPTIDLTCGLSSLDTAPSNEVAISHFLVARCDETHTCTASVVHEHRLLLVEQGWERFQHRSAHPSRELLHIRARVVLCRSGVIVFLVLACEIVPVSVPMVVVVV